MYLVLRYAEITLKSTAFENFQHLEAVEVQTGEAFVNIIQNDFKGNHVVVTVTKRWLSDSTTYLCRKKQHL